MHAFPVCTAQLMNASRERAEQGVTQRALQDHDCAVPCLGLALLGGAMLWASLGIGLSLVL